MYCGSNKTALSSQKQIAEALLRLMADHPYADISVSSLCREAGISRQTFYSLFTSRENVVVFTLQANYCYAPSEALSRGGEGEKSGGLRALCRGYAAYILQNRDFLRMMVKNRIDYLLYDSISEALGACECFLPGVDSRVRPYAVSFYAGGISSVARTYAREGCAATEKELEQLLYLLLSGSLL